MYSPMSSSTAQCLALLMPRVPEQCGSQAKRIQSSVQYEYTHAFKIHRQRVARMKAAIDTAPPEDFTHFQYNAKRAMMQAERLFEIERVRLTHLPYPSVYRTAPRLALQRAWLGARPLRQPPQLSEWQGPTVACF